MVSLSMNDSTVIAVEQAQYAGVDGTYGEIEIARPCGNGQGTRLGLGQ